LGGTFPHKIANHHQTGGNAGPSSKYPAGRCWQPADRLNCRKAGPHCALGIVLVGSRPSEVGQHAVAHEFGNVAIEAGNLAGYGILVGPQHLAHILRVEAG
jgi:hypothetical protein